jgi:hypothetical protein
VSDERLLAAARAFQQWSGRIVAIVVACFGIGGLGLILFFDIYVGAHYGIESTGFYLAVAFGLAVVLVVGRAVAVGVINSRKRATIVRLARAHDVPPDQLARKVGVNVRRLQA